MEDDDDEEGAVVEAFLVQATEGDEEEDGNVDGARESKNAVRKERELAEREERIEERERTLEQKMKQIVTAEAIVLPIQEGAHDAEQDAGSTAAWRSCNNTSNEKESSHFYFYDLAEISIDINVLDYYQ